MTSLPFDYERPDSLKQALSLIAEPGSVVLAGGQSLVPLLNRRVVTPKRIVDITRIPDLKKIELGDDVMRIGAIVRLADIEKHAALAHFPLLAEAIASTASPAIRNRAPLIGNLVRASAMSELAVVAGCLVAEDITFAPELPHAAYALEVLPVVMSRAVARAAENIQPV